MIWKFLHLVGGILLIGNVVTTGLWSHWAIARQDRALAVFAAGAILWADLILTLGGGALLTIAGIMRLLELHLPVMQTPWLLHGIGFLLASTLVWLVALLPLQLRLLRQARAGDLQALRKTFLWWSVLGWADTALLFGGLWVMVIK